MVVACRNCLLIALEAVMLRMRPGHLLGEQPRSLVTVERLRPRPKSITLSRVTN